MNTIINTMHIKKLIEIKTLFLLTHDEHDVSSLHDMRTNDGAT
jgi:hypothetical protein